MSGNDRPFFLSQNEGFLQAQASADLLHPQQNALVKEDSLTETQYFGFSVPKARIHCFAYMWHHPNLRVVTGGLFVWRGIKHCMVQSELCDFGTYMSDSVLANDLHDYRLANGFGVKILEPLQRFCMTYTDRVRDTSVDLVYEAIGPLVMFQDGKHFEQPMRVTGELVLRGEHHAVDCFNVRDRSWGKGRPEANIPRPPMSWMTGVFSRDFSFTCSVFDQVSGNPELAGPFALSDDSALSGGWIYRDGKLGRMVQARKRVVRDVTSLRPAEIVLGVVDEFGRHFSICGKLVASCPWQAWGNVNSNVNLMQWECEGLTTHGDCQEALWNDYCNFMARTVSPNVDG